MLGTNKSIIKQLKNSVAHIRNGLTSFLEPMFLGNKRTKLLLSEDKVGYDVVPTIDYELANKAYVDFRANNPLGSLNIAGDLTISGDATINGNTLTFGNGEIIHNTSDGFFTFIGSDFVIDKTGSTSAAKVALFADSGYDASLLLYNAALVKWSIGNDANDSNKLKFDAGNATVGGATKATLDASGNFLTAGTITDGSGNVLGSGGGGGAIDISGTPSTNQYARWTDADTLEGRSTSDVLSDIGAQASGNYITGTGSLSAQDLTDIGNLSGTNTGDQATGISDGNILECNSNVADNDFLKIDGTKVEGRTASEVLSDIGVYDIQRVGYNSTSASASFLPLNGYIVERTSTASNNEYIAFVAPYNGTLEKIMWRSEIAQSGTFRNLLYESSDGTEVPGAGHGRWDIAVDVADDTTIEFDFTTGASSGTNVLTKGRIYAISIDPVSAPQDTNATVVFKWDVTT